MPDGEYDAETQRLILGAYLLRVIAEANGGEEPKTIWQYRRVARRLGVRIRMLPAEALQEALLRSSQRAGQQGVIYVRRTHNVTHLRRDLLHELAEAAAHYEGVAPWVCQVSRHEAACAAVTAYRRA